MEPKKDIFEEWDDIKNNQTWIERKINSFGNWWDNEGRYLFRSFKQGIKNIVYWVPVIWRDRHWDSHYIFEILKHKLILQSNYISKNDRHTRAQHDVKNMRICVRLIKLVQDGFYESEYSDYHKTKHWTEPLKGNEGISTWKSKLLEENFDDYFTKYPLIYKKVLKGEGIFNLEGREEDKQVIAMNISRINQSRALKLLFKLMEKNILKWWD